MNPWIIALLIHCLIALCFFFPIYIDADGNYPKDITPQNKLVISMILAFFWEIVLGVIFASKLISR